MKNGFSFFVCTLKHTPLKVDLNKLLFTANTKLVLSLETQMVSYFHSFYCHIFAIFLMESKLFSQIYES